MPIKYTRPQLTVDIVTDLVALQKTLMLTQELVLMQQDETNAIREGRSADEVLEEIHKTKELADRSVITVTLQGLNHSKWSEFVLKNTETKEGEDAPTTNVKEAALDAFPAMIVKAQYKMSKRSVSNDDVEQLLPNLADSQITDIITTIQNLNEPTTTFPKELTQLIWNSSPAL